MSKRTPSAAQLKGLAKGRATQAYNRTHNSMVNSDIASLRSQVAEEIAKSQFSAGMNVTLGDIDEEYVPDLKSLRNRTRIFERMANDPIIRGQLRAIYMTLTSGVRWKVEGGSQEQQDLVASNLLRQGDRHLWMASSWLDFLHECLGVLIYGFSLFGKTRVNVGDKNVFGHLAWLHPRSVSENGWRMTENDELYEIWRSYTAPDGTHYSQEPIPIEDVFMLCWDRRGPNWEGNSFIRPMYRPWVLNEMAEKIDMIDLQNRGVGIPVAKLSGSGGPKERDTLIEILKSLRGGDKSRAFIVLEQDEEIEFLTSKNPAREAEGTMRQHRKNIVKAGGTEFFDSASGEGGSKGGASALATGFFINVDGIRVQLEEMINFGVGPMPGIVQELQDMNFDNVKEYARIVGSRVSPTEQLDNVPILIEAIQKKAIPANRKHANELAEKLGYALLTEEEYEKAIEEQKAAIPGTQDAGGGSGRPNGPGKDADGRDDPNATRLSDAEKKTLGASPHLKRPASWPWLRSPQA